MGMLLPFRRVSRAAGIALLGSVLLLLAVAYTTHAPQSAPDGTATDALAEVAAVHSGMGGRRRLLARLLQGAEQWSSGTRYSSRPVARPATYVRPVYRPTYARPYTSTYARPYTSTYARPYRASSPASAALRPAMKVAAAAMRPPRTNNNNNRLNSTALPTGNANTAKPVNNCQKMVQGLPMYDYGAPGCEPAP